MCGLLILYSIIMRKKTQHIVKHSNGWAVKSSGSSKATKVFSKQSSAFRFGRGIAISQKTELFLHGRNGQIRERNSYGNDPKSIKG